MWHNIIVAVYELELGSSMYGVFQMALLKYFKNKVCALPVVSCSYARILFQIRVDLSQAKYLLHIAAANSVEIVNVSIFSPKSQNIVRTRLPYFIKPLIQ